MRYFAGSGIFLQEVAETFVCAPSKRPESIKEKWNWFASVVEPHKPPFDGSSHITGHNLFVSAYHGFAILGNEHIPEPVPFVRFPMFDVNVIDARRANGCVVLRCRLWLSGADDCDRYRVLGKVLRHTIREDASQPVVERPAKGQREIHLNVYAYKDGELTEKTELYAAPFFNVTGASVCLGSANIEKPRDLTYEKLLEYWEKKFWLTEFSHLGANGNPTRSNLVLVTKAAKERPFNLEELKPLDKMKLKDILK